LTEWATSLRQHTDGDGDQVPAIVMCLSRRQRGAGVMAVNDTAAPG
jgi:hypothetical protein